MKKVTLLLSLFILACCTLKAQDSLQLYVGKYKFPEGSVVAEISVILEDGKLSLNSAMGNAALEKTGEDQFSITQYGGTATFTRNQLKKITGIHIEAMGAILDGNKEETKSLFKKSETPMRFPIPKMPMENILLVTE
jgi:hypothetical protein